MQNNDIFQQAKRRIDRRRLEQMAAQSRRMDEIAEKIPEVMEIRRKLAMTSAETSKVILQRKTNLAEGLARIEEVNLRLQQRERELMQQAGYPVDYLEMQYTCPKCRDTGFVDGVRCECLKAEMRRLSVEQLNASSPFQECSFEDFDLSFYPDVIDPQSGQNPRFVMTRVFNFCRNYAEKFNPHSQGLFMFGQTGLGKTHLSRAIAGVVAAKGYNVVCGSAQDLLRRIENEHFRRTEDDGTLDRILEADLLVLDDLGAEFSSSFTQSVVYNILNSRISAERPLIVTSNLTVQEFNDKYAHRIVSRLFSQLIQVRFIGNDVRQLKSLRKPESKK